MSKHNGGTRIVPVGPPARPREAAHRVLLSEDYKVQDLTERGIQNIDLTQGQPLILRFFKERFKDLTDVVARAAVFAVNQVEGF